MALRAMNNTEKEAAKILKDKGFTVFWFDSYSTAAGYYATHAKLIFQYCILSKAKEALEHLERLQPKQTSLFNN